MALFDPSTDGSSTLAVLTLGAVGDDRPLPTLQPPLKEGIHLRWAFDPARGFPWYGFYLLRRLSPTGGTATCASSQFGGLTPGPRPSTSLAIGLGTFQSDQNLVLTDDFPATGAVEIDLSNRQFVSFQLDPSLPPSRRVDVSIGFLTDFPPPGGGPGTDGGGGPPFGGLGGSAATTGICGCGCAHDAVRPVVERVVAIGPGQYRATFGYDNEGTASISMAVGPENRFFPDPADRGQPTLFLAGRRTDVFSVVFDGRPLTWRLAGNTVTVSAADAQGGSGGGTGGTGAGGSADGIVVTALRTGVPVATAVVAGRAGTVVKASLVFDAIDQVIVSSGPARLVDVCAFAVTDSLGQGWAPVPNFPQPMALPVKSPNYPISSGQPDVNASQAVALNRISYAFPVVPGSTTLDLSEWSANFPQIHQLLVAIVQNGPNGPLGITDSIQTVTADTDPNDPTDFRPTWTNQSSLAVLLSGTINPAMAQMLGLYWVDDTTSEGQSYDYLLVADYHNAGNGNVNTILALVTAQNYANIDAYLKMGATRAVTAPLAPPDATTLQAYALPLASVPPSAPPDSVGLAGLSWGIPNASDQTVKISPTGAILFHAWRKDFGRGAPGPGETYDPATFTRVTELAIAPGAPRTSDPTASPLAGWPAVNLFDVDGPLPEGWYAYRISGIDIFGRYSALSDVAPALDISGKVLDAQPVHIIDTTPPPPPVFVQAWLLDPQDPFVLQDPAYTTWRGTHAGVVGLRVRWAWGAGQRRQAPDTREFRIYLNPLVPPATQLDNPSVATSWAQRIAIVGVNEQVVAQSLQPLQTPTTPPQNITGTSVSINGADVTLQDGPALDSVLAGESELQLVVGGVASQFAVLNVDATQRVVTVDQSLQQIGTVTGWSLLPLRTYEVFLPGATVATAPVFSPPAPPPRATPVAYSLVGVSAADDKDRDDPRLTVPGPQALTPRPGNEGNVGGPATIVQVLRAPPAPPPAPFDQDSLLATRADFLSHSFFTLHALKQPPGQPAMSVHVYRALDETLFAVDGAKGFSNSKRTTEANTLSLATLGPTWTTARQSAALAQLGTSLTGTDSYAKLSNDALRVLASLPSNASAFSCITRIPLDPSKTPDIKGLSDPDTYNPAARTDLAGFTDILDGRANNVYFYKTTLVDTAQNQSDLKQSFATPPVRLPVVVVPPAPVLVDAGASTSLKVRLVWQSSADPGVTEYRIYRSDHEAQVQRLAESDRVFVVPEPLPPSQRPATVTKNDLTVPAATTFFYAVTAAAVPPPTTPPGVTLESGPSRVVAIKAFDDSRPAPPTWNPPQPQAGGSLLLSWTTSDSTLVQFLVQRLDPTSQSWVAISSWLAAGVAQFTDTQRTAGVHYQYRLLVIDNRGRQNNVFSTVTA